MGSWQIVGYPDDPIPDNPGVVASQTAHLRSVAATIGTQVAALPQSGQVDALVWRSQNNDAPAQFRQMASQLPHDLDLLRTRYLKVAAALEEFQPVLAQTKAQAQANLTVALSAYQDMQAAQAGIQQMNDFQYQAQQAAANQNRNLPPGKPPVQPASWTGPDYPAMLTDAQTRFNNAKSQIDAAVNHFQSASQTAANRVNAAGNDSLKNQSSGFWGFVSDVIKYGTPVGELVWAWDNRGTLVHDMDHALIDVAAWSGDLSALAALVSLLPIPGVDVIADAVSEAASGLEVAADLGIMATDSNAAERKSALHDLEWAAVGLATAGVARGLGKAAELAKDLRGADEALNVAKAAKAGKEAELADAVKGADKAQNTAVDTLTAASKDPELLPFALADVNAARDAIATAATKSGELDEATEALSDVADKQEEAVKAFTPKGALKPAAIHFFTADVVTDFKAIKAAKDPETFYSLLKPSALKAGSLGVKQFALAGSSLAVNLGTQAAEDTHTVSGLLGSDSSSGSS